MTEATETTPAVTTTPVELTADEIKVLEDLEEASTSGWCTTSRSTPTTSSRST
jgi:regulatory protein YycI of two-component signal transduction system YycFG